MKYGNLTLGRMEAVINKLGGMDGVDRFLRGEITVSEPERVWREQDGVIYFSVTSNGMTGEEWIGHLGSNDFHVSAYAKEVLRSPGFTPTDGVTTEVAVLKELVFSGNSHTTRRIRAEADKRNLTKPNAEVACLIREKFTDEEIEAMGLWWVVVMHEPINSSGGPYLLSADRDRRGGCLSAYYDWRDLTWDRCDGFAFAVPQV